MTISHSKTTTTAWRVPLPATGVFSRLYFPEQDPATASKKTLKEFTK